MKKLLILAFGAALLAACDNSDSYKQECGTQEQISISALMAEITPGTRTSDNGTNASWVTNDVVGLFCTASNPAAANLQVTYNGTDWPTATAIYWSDYSSLHKFYAYAPYASGNTADAVKIPVLNAQTGTIDPAQNILFSNNLDAGITKTSNAGSAPLTFKHALALIQLDITIDSKVPVGTKLLQASISGQVADAITTSTTGATLNLVSGAITNGSATSNSVIARPTTSPTLSSTATTEYVLLLPSSFSPTLTLQCTLPDATTPSTSVSMGTNLTFAQNTKYTFTVTLSRNAITITSMTITPWVSGGAATPISPVL